MLCVLINAQRYESEGMSTPISPPDSTTHQTPNCTAHSFPLLLLPVPQAMDDQSKALSSRGVVDSGTMRSLVRAQEATGKAHVTIQVKPLLNTSSIFRLFACHLN
jgi:hypothetical protein